MEIALDGEGEVLLRFIDAKGRTLLEERLAVSGSSTVRAIRIVPLVLETTDGELPVAAVLVAATFMPVFPRLALVACVPGLALACGAAVSWIPVRAAAGAVVGALAVAAVVGLARWYAGTPAEDWRSAAESKASQ